MSDACSSSRAQTGSTPHNMKIWELGRQQLVEFTSYKECTIFKALNFCGFVISK